jgi:hypothetical protein
MNLGGAPFYVTGVCHGTRVLPRSRIEGSASTFTFRAHSKLPCVASPTNLV